MACLPARGKCTAAISLPNSPLLATVTFPNGLATTWTYEATRNLVDHVENKLGGTSVSKYDYTNDTIGRRTGVQKSGTAFTATETMNSINCGNRGRAYCDGTFWSD